MAKKAKRGALTACYRFSPPPLQLPPSSPHPSSEWRSMSSLGPRYAALGARRSAHGPRRAALLCYPDVCVLLGPPGIVTYYDITYYSLLFLPLTPGIGPPALRYLIVHAMRGIPFPIVFQLSRCSDHTRWSSMELCSMTQHVSFPLRSTSDR